MLIGFDFDNTIVCYDQAIAALAEELFDLPKLVPRNKIGLRDYLRSEGREREWTEFQGELYGPGMRYAHPFEGSIEAMKELEALGHQLVIVSHRSLRPYAGLPHDLHAAARQWIARILQAQGLFTDEDVYFLETREAKFSTIVQLGCTVFVDDLSEVIDAAEFPDSTIGVLFDPIGELNANRGNYRISAWKQIPTLLA